MFMLFVRFNFSSNQTTIMPTFKAIIERFDVLKRHRYFLATFGQLGRIVFFQNEGMNNNKGC